jgi:release factor glutamine methyltransferase
MDFRKKILNALHPVIKPMLVWYTSSTRIYSYGQIRVCVYPGVFHPGLFLSTKLLLEDLSSRDLLNKEVLELGAGTGLISIFCAKRNARVTSSDISPTALNCTQRNAEMNDVQLALIESDVFDSVPSRQFDYIVINPPYYPKAVQQEKDYPWFCGENFEYFTKLFEQLPAFMSSATVVLMILSEDCRIDHIRAIGLKNQLYLALTNTKKIYGEKNFIFEIRRNNIA